MHGIVSTLVRRIRYCMYVCRGTYSCIVSRNRTIQLYRIPDVYGIPGVVVAVGRTLWTPALRVCDRRAQCSYDLGGLLPHSICGSHRTQSSILIMPPPSHLPLASHARTGTKGATSEMPETCTCAVHSAARCQSQCHVYMRHVRAVRGTIIPSRQHHHDDPDDRVRRRGLSFSPREGGEDRLPRTGAATAVAMHAKAAPSGKGSCLVTPVARCSCAL